MARRDRERRRVNNPPPGPPPARGFDPLAMITVGGVVILLMITFANWREIDRIQESLDTKLGQIETRIAQVSEKVEKIPSQAPAQQRRRGPDPNKVYTIKTDGRPSKGPTNAAVTIAEFSDFQ